MVASVPLILASVAGCARVVSVCASRRPALAPARSLLRLSSMPSRSLWLLRPQGHLLVALALVGSVGGAGGCLITSDADFNEPAQTRPYLSRTSASPALDQILITSPTSDLPVVFSARVQSEDNGQAVQARLVADWPGTSGTLGVATLSPAPFSAGDRLFSISWAPNSPTLTTGEPLSVGCHPVTLIVTHQFNELTNQPARSDDVDLMTWWVVVIEDGGDLATTLATCPSLLKRPISATSQEAP